MVRGIRQTHDIQPVGALRLCDGDLQVILLNGTTACVRKGNREYQRIRQLVQKSLTSGCLLSFTVNDAGELLELNYADQSAVRRVRLDEDDSNRLMIEFWAYSPICYLTKDHPEFERITLTLERAAATDEQVVFANCPHMVEGETETWWKIIDVRAP